MTRANHPDGPVAASHRSSRTRSRSLAWYGVRVSVSILGRVILLGVLAIAAFQTLWAGLVGVALVGLSELGRD